MVVHLNLKQKVLKTNKNNHNKTNNRYPYKMLNRSFFTAFSYWGVVCIQLSYPAIWPNLKQKVLKFSSSMSCSKRTIILLCSQVPKQHLNGSDCRKSFEWTVILCRCFSVKCLEITNIQKITCYWAGKRKGMYIEQDKRTYNGNLTPYGKPALLAK